jgi:hypothetical protein
VYFFTWWTAAAEVEEELELDETISSSRGWGRPWYM